MATSLRYSRWEPFQGNKLGEENMAKNKGQRRKKGMLRILFYVVLIISVGAAVILADAMSEELDYDIDTIKYGGAGLIGLIVLIDVAQGMLTKKKAAPPMKSYKAPGPVSSPSKKRMKEKKVKKEPTIQATKVETKPKKKKEEEYDTLEVPKPSRYAAELKSLAETKKPQERKIISYPPEVGGGKYGDCYIPIDKYTILKVRTLLAQAEVVAEEEIDIEEYAEYEAGVEEEYYDEGAGEEYPEEGYGDEEYDGEGDDEEYGDEGYGDEEGNSEEDYADESYSEEEYDEENYDEGDYKEGDEDYSDEYDEEEEQ